MQIHQIRNATMKISLAGKTILTDPVLLPRHAIESFAGKEKNPVVDLPIPAEEVIRDINMVLVSHLHQDHFDEGARKMLPRDIPLYCLPCHAANLTERGFSKVVPIDGTVAWEGIRITRTPGEHAGNEKWKKILGPVTGFFLEAQGEPKIYWAGDTILNDKVVNQIKTLNPDIILTHSCGAFLEDSGPIVMDAKMTIDVCRLAPDAVVVATHMEALDHASVTRKDLRALADREGVSREHLLIPADGEILKF